MINRFLKLFLLIISKLVIQSHSKMTMSFILEGFRFHTPHLNSFHFLLKIFWKNKEIQYSCATSAKISFNKFGSNKILPQTWTSNWNLKLRSGLTLYFPPSYEVLPILQFLRKHQNHSVLCFCEWANSSYLRKEECNPHSVYFSYSLHLKQNTRTCENRFVGKYLSVVVRSLRQ